MTYRIDYCRVVDLKPGNTFRFPASSVPYLVSVIRGARVFYKDPYSRTSYESIGAHSLQFVYLCSSIATKKRLYSPTKKKVHILRLKTGQGIL